MTDLLKILKRQSITLRKTTKWTTLIVERLPADFKTSRIGKIQGSALYFTIGETNHGRAVGLDKEIRNIIGGEKLPIREIPSTSGNGRVYVGFEWHNCTPGVVERVVQSVLNKSRPDATESGMKEPLSPGYLL